MASTHIPEESNPPPASILSKGGTGSNAKSWGTKTREAVRFVAGAITDSQTPSKTFDANGIRGGATAANALKRKPIGLKGAYAKHRLAGANDIDINLGDATLAAMTNLEYDKSGNNNEAEEEEQEVYGIFTGEYQFVSYDEKLEDYLDSLGLPGKEYGAIIRTAEVRVVVREPPTYASGRKRRESLSGADKKWSVIHYDKVDGMENATSFAFELDKPYTVQRDDEEEITVCSKGGSSSNPQEKDNVLHYRTEVPIRGWKIENRSVFTDEGITAHIRNLVIKSDNASTNGTSIVTKMHLKRTKNWQAWMTKN